MLTSTPRCAAVQIACGKFLSWLPRCFAGQGRGVEVPEEETFYSQEKKRRVPKYFPKNLT